MVKDSDQDSNDLDKSLAILKTELNSEASQQQSVLVLGAMGGRFDQEMANVNALYQWRGVFKRLVLVDVENTCILLEPGLVHRILPMVSRGDEQGEGDWKVLEGRYCGLLPLGQEAACVRTSGLCWNLHDEPLAFGCRISTSNTVPLSTTEVTVQTSHPLLWTCTYELSKP